MEIKLGDVTAAIKARIKLIILITFIFAAVGVITSLLLKDKYVSVATLASNSSSGNSGLLSAFSDYASMMPIAGLNLSSGEGQVEHSLEFMRSWAFSNHMVSKYDLYSELFAIKKWIRSSDTIIFDEDIFDPTLNEWKLKLPDGSFGKPTPLMVHKEFSKIVTFLYEPGDGLLTISLEASSPNIAKHWLELIITESNDYFRKKAEKESEENIKTLNEIMASTSLQNVNEAALGLIEQQMETLMFTKAKDEYLFTTLVKPFLPEKKTKPKRALILYLIYVLGAIIAVFVAIFIEVRSDSYNFESDK